MRRAILLGAEFFNTVWGLPNVTRRQCVRAYPVSSPTTVYVRASYSQVVVHRVAESRVQIELDLRQSFGWQWTTDSDEHGVYIALKRKRVVGALSYAKLTLTVPPDAHLVLHLTPGNVGLENVQGRLTIAPPELPTSAGAAGGK